VVGDWVSGEMSRRLEEHGWEVASIEDNVWLPSEAQGPQNLASASAAFNKIHVWGLHDEFDKVLYLDADVMVLRSLDDVFDRDISAGLPIAAAPEIMPPDSILPFPSLPLPSLPFHTFFHCKPYPTLPFPSPP